MKFLLTVEKRTGMRVDSYKQTAEQILRGLGRAERLITTCAFTALIAIMFLDVLSRETTGVGLHWARQVGVYANIVVVMFGLGLASAGGNHIRPRFADNWLPSRWNPVIHRLQDGLMSAFCLFAAGAGGQLTWESIRLGERSTLLPVLIWPVLMVIPLAFFLVGIRHAIYAACPDLRPPDPLAAGVDIPPPAGAAPPAGADDAAQSPDTRQPHSRPPKSS